ncbi:hybrid sensor histidine kinase/response regulator [Falsigemmobacter intermedius]|uniref:histidine kinase n=1 Tax=Falsigemmobacter intermedius TaxID=1553448 RepID=A0A3S3UWB1_9RHOB|nr:hybrid sensor histidine kinase/response regulator [Falsigemmobacter intermedius]RWY41462.1 hybrid sensor histidine kinase/response regulator [Falsigemmobacter intermedius]
MHGRTTDLELRIRKLEKINTTLMERLVRIGETRGPGWVQTRTAAVLERELIGRNRDLEDALQRLARINAELEQANSIADEANRAKSRFLRAASHDLLQPLSAAKLFLSHLEETSADGGQSDLIRTVTATLDSAGELIEALSNIARLDSRKFETNRVPLAIDRLFRRLEIDTRPLAEARQVDLRFVASSVTVESDPVYLRQIAQNLITNALKYTTGDRVLIGLRRQGGVVWLEVLDRGPGIHPRDQERVFIEFERLSCTSQPGTGLGLSIVRRACDQLGHRLELHSKPGSGSRFRVALPLYRGSTPQENEPGKDAPLKQPDYSGQRVLIVENDPNMRRAVAMLLGGWGFETITVAGVAEAITAAEAKRPDLVVTDYRLDNGETGIDVLRDLAPLWRRRPPAVIISAEDTASIRQEAGTLARRVLRKPFTDKALRDAIEAIFADRPKAER